MKRQGKTRIILGCILLFLQIISIIGNTYAGNTIRISFANIKIFFFDLLYLFGYFLVGIIGAILLISGLITLRKNTSDEENVDSTATDKIATLFVEALDDATKNCQEKGPIIFNGQRPDEDDYGYSATNPLCTMGLGATDSFIERLRTPDGKSFTWNRVGSLRVDCNGATDVGVDKYQLYLDGEPYKVLYFIMYVGTSTNPPAGLMFADTETKPVVSSTGSNQNNANTINKKYCSKCGSVIDQDNKICTGCGKQYFKGIKYYLSTLFTKKNAPLIIVSFLLVISLITTIVLACNSNSDDTDNKNVHKIDKSLYTVCTVEELYKNPQKYNHTSVAITSWNVICQYREQTIVGTFYDFLLCDDLTHYADKSNYPIVPVYNYYTECIKPYSTPYVGVRIFSDFIYKDISKTKSRITIYGTFTYNPNVSEGGYISEPHVYNIDAVYYE